MPVSDLLHQPHGSVFAPSRAPPQRSPPTTPSSPPTCNTRLFARKEDLPTDLSPGTYVVVDVLFFSTTVIELLANGASYLHVPDTRDGSRAFKETRPHALIGGEGTANHEPSDGFDFFNSPSYVAELDSTHRPASLTSFNGGSTVNQLRKRAAQTDAQIETYLGSTTNARELGTHLRTVPGPIHYVCAGSCGETAIEDVIGARLIERYRRGRPLETAERNVYQNIVRTAKGPYDPTDDPHRHRDTEIATDFNHRTVVPMLDGRRLYDINE